MGIMPRMLSLTAEDHLWLKENNVNLSKFTRRSIQACREVGKNDVAEIIYGLRNVNTKLNELISAYEMDANSPKGRVQ